MYTPEIFLQHIADGNNDLDVWLDAAMKDEIKLSRPRATDIGSDGQRSAERLAEECAKLFPPGRVFCCKKQLVAMAKTFAIPWAFKVTVAGKSSKCFYASPEIKGKKTPAVSPSNRRKGKGSPKKAIKCPFVIKWTYEARGSPPGTDPEFLPARVTSPDFLHTCNPAPALQRLAMVKGGMCLVVYNRYLIKSDAVNRLTASNFCLECTIIREGGAEDQVYKKALFG
jgi:hypothetical protein